MEKRCNQANLIVRESIETALLQLLREKPIDKIRIGEIVTRAGVSRVSFYRNYYYKEDVIFAAMDKIAARWKEETEKKEGDFNEKVLELFESERSILGILYRNGLEHLMYRLIRRYCGLEAGIDDNVGAYFMSLVAGAYYGWCDEWVRRGMQETPEEIKAVLRNLTFDKNAPS